MKLDYLIWLIYLCCGTLGIICIKLFLNTFHYESISDAIPKLFNIIFISGVVLYISSFLLWMYILSKTNINIAYPISTSLLFLMITISSVLILRERLSWSICIGSIVCLAGICIIVFDGIL